MIDGSPGRTRPAIEKLMLIAVVICLGIAVGRLVWAITAVPQSIVASRTYAAAVKAGSVPATETTVMERIAHNPRFDSWWGTRDIPFRSGGDYLAVISHHVATRALGDVIGLLAEQDRKKGILIDRVIVPADRELLYGQESGKLITLADGTESRTYWAQLYSDAKHFSDVRVNRKRYDPVITAEQAASLDATAGLVLRSKTFYVGAPRAGGSGTWILLVRIREVREYLLVPIELNPVPGVL